MKHNFNAGPCVLPKPAIESAIEAIRDFDNTGIGILEISHRTPGWERIMAETEQLWRDLLSISEEYAVLFLGGGASTQFYHLAANLLNKKAVYLQTGVWAKKAIKEAKFYGEVSVVASSEDKNYSYIPKGYTIPTDADYFHITTNNTIYGTEIHEDIDSPVPLVADMSSDIMSRPVDVRQYCINLQIRLQVYYKLTAGGLQAFIANFLTKTSNGTGFGKKKPGKITFAGLRLPRNCSFAYNCFIESGCSPPDGRLRGPTCRQRNTHRAYHARSAQRKRRGLRLHRPRR